jgi:TatD DNase family protein
VRGIVPFAVKSVENRVGDGGFVFEYQRASLHAVARSTIRGPVKLFIDRRGRLTAESDMAVIDTHCHLDLTAREGVSAEAALENAEAAGVRAVVQISTALESARYNRDLARTRRVNASGSSLRYYWTAGLHPESAPQIAELDDIFAIARECRDEAEFLGLGETGLDYFHTTEFVREQKQSFERHLALAAELRLPVVVHLRDDRVYNPDRIATAVDALEIVRRFPGVRGVLHCYTYTEREAMPFVELGWFVSYSGVLTFKNAPHVQQGAVALPLDCLMVETDAPFLAPNPKRGQTNQPAYVTHTLEFLAKLRAEKNGEDPEVVKAAVLKNSERFIQLKNEL